MAKCFVTKYLGEFDNDNLPYYDTLEIQVTPNVANAGNWAARIINIQSPNDVVISTKDGGNHIAYVKGDWIGEEPKSLTNKVTVPANTNAGVYMKDDVEYSVLVSGLSSFTYIGSTNGGTSARDYKFNIEQLAYSTNLTSIYFVYDRLYGDISSLKGLTNLTSIGLTSHNTTGDISSLKGLTNLTSIGLHNTNITGDISSLKGLTNLTSIDLHNTNITGDISTLATLVNLTEIYVDSNSDFKVSGDVKTLFDAIAKTGRSDSLSVYWKRSNLTYSGDTSMTPSKSCIKATFDGNGGYTVAVFD